MHRLLAIIAIGIAALGYQAPAPGSLRVATVDAPPLRQAAVLDEADLGAWDQVLEVPELDFLLLLRDNQLYSLTAAAATPRLETALPEVRGSRIVRSVVRGDEVWLFLESADAHPIAFEVHSRTRLDFPVPGLTTPPDRPAEIQSSLVGPGSSSAVLMVAGGEREHWPRPGNRPLYFWVGFGPRRVRLLPVGWDLSYFSGELKTAVFDTVSEQGSSRRVPAALDLLTGEVGVVVPDRSRLPWVPFDWTNSDPVQPLHSAADNPPGSPLVGLSVDGRALPLGLSVDSPYRFRAKIARNWAGIGVKGYGSPRTEDSPLWFADVTSEESPQLLATGVTFFQPLDGARCLLAQGSSRRSKLPRVLMYDKALGGAWEVFAGMGGLAEPEKQQVGRVQFGSTVHASMDAQSQSVLVQLEQYRYSAEALSRLESQTWRGAVLVTSNGRRFRVAGLEERPLSRHSWMLDAATVVLGREEEAGPGVGRMRLSRVRLDLTVE